jgi:aspartyl-tRNA(Asn)/glutamyl-tRNA(Gln) amidotransferase subunit A
MRLPDEPAHRIASAVRAREVTASQVVETALERIAAADNRIHAFTAVAADRARARARHLDATIAAGNDVGPLVGVPFAVKAMIDVAGLVTTAGSALHLHDAPAVRDSEVVQRLESAGGICVGALNMDEFGMGGTTENSCFGSTHNPHDLARTPGGSSGGCAAALAAGLVPIAIGSDALGSIRLPASLCGVYGLRPTRGAVPARGVLGGGGTISTLGPMARTERDIAITHAVLIAQRGRASDSSTSLRIAVACGYFSDRLDADAASSVERVARALDVRETIEFPDAACAKAAATLINAAESSVGRLPALRERASEFHPGVRDRFIAHALMPAQWYVHAQSYRAAHKRRVLDLLERVDVLVLPATPTVAPPLGQQTLRIGDQDWPTGPMLGWFTQPLAGIDCPVLTVPVARARALPIGVQLLAAPHREQTLFDVAARLESLTVASAPIASLT